MAFHTHIKQWGNNLLYIGYSDSGQRIQKKIQYEPRLWATSQNESSWKDVFDNDIEEVSFESIKEAKEFISKFNNVNNFKVFGVDKFDQLFLAETYSGDIDYNLNYIRTFTIDIENLAGPDGRFVKPEEATAPITLITIHDSKYDKFIVFANVETTNTRYTPDSSLNIDYREHNNEISMLQDFLLYWSNNYPDIVTGWNTRGYDIVYIINRINIILGSKSTNKLSPWGVINAKKSNVYRFGQKREDTVYEILGINELDYMDLYMKYNMSNSESFALDYIANKELGANKIKYTGKLDDLYRNDFQKYVDYNIHDVRLVVDIDKKKQFLNLIIDMSYFGHVSSYNDTLGTVRYWEYLIFNHLYNKKKLPQITSRDEIEDSGGYEGAYVMDPIVGMHKWVVSVDATSLYPSIIRQVNIGPDTHIDNSCLNGELLKVRSNTKENYLSLDESYVNILQQYNYGLACNNELYSNNKQSFLSELMESLFNKRKEYKKTMIDYKKELSNIEKEINSREKL